MPHPYKATLWPNRSLSPALFYGFMAGASAIVTALSALFAFAGAWPVSVFMVMMLIAVCCALRANIRAGRAYEKILLTEAGLHIRRVDCHGASRSWTFVPGWVCVHLHRPADDECRLFLTAHGKRLELGKCLCIQERAEFAAALTAALGRLRQPFSSPKTSAMP